MGPVLSEKMSGLADAKLKPGAEAIADLLSGHGLSTEVRATILHNAQDLLANMRARANTVGIAQSLFQEIDMATPEGLALITLAEALLRIPDTETVDSLLQEKLAQGDWHNFRDSVSSPKLKSLGLAVEAASKLTDINSLLFKTTGVVGLPAVRIVTQRIMEFMATRFVFSTTIESALTTAAEQNRRTRFSFDMLGEGARTYQQASAFKDAYMGAISALGRAVARKEPLECPSISVKLSALHPRFEVAKTELLQAELFPLVADLATLAKSLDVAFTIDAEEADRLELTLEIFEDLARLPRLRGWSGLGLAVQAYSKRATGVIRWLDALGQDVHSRFPVRLVKGAYWDAEIKHAQAEGLSDYPVYTHKAATDVSYLSCARLILDSDHISGQFATHNAYTVSAIAHMAGGKEFEFQRLHGMGDQLYDALAAQGNRTPVRVYAPVGEFKELLPYLVRRMLENTANTSFARAALDLRQDIADVVKDPISELENAKPTVTLPRDIYGNRKNAKGLDLSDRRVLETLRSATQHAARDISQTSESSVADVQHAILTAKDAFDEWAARPVTERADILERAADIFEKQSVSLIGLIVAEAGRSLDDGIAEVRETVDFCRYYAVQARHTFKETALPAITGEKNVLRLTGRGVFACISPWNFPLAIFSGQIVAALVAGNTVVAKPAPQTPQVAKAALAILREAGVPVDALKLVFGAGNVGAALTSDERIAGVAFTGSTATAKGINRALANREGPIGVLIAETGGINAMFVDASALPEQVVDDVIASGFMSAGQRCSSLRHLFLHEDIAESVIAMIAGAMETLRVGDPANPATDVGPVIDAAAVQTIEQHIVNMRDKGARIVKQSPLTDECSLGTFVAPTLIELPDPTLLQAEVFGPVVHVTRWRSDNLQDMLSIVRQRGYGLTLGVHSRISGFADTVKAHLPTGNTYINRNTVGAVVGAQPFGGCGLSGTGPKAGGPHYLLRFATEEVITTNLTAIGGDVKLLTGAA